MSKTVSIFAEGFNNLADHTAANRVRALAFGLKFINNVLAGTAIADATGDRSHGANGMPAALQREMQAFGSRL